MDQEIMVDLHTRAISKMTNDIKEGCGNAVTTIGCWFINVIYPVNCLLGTSNVLSVHVWIICRIKLECFGKKLTKHHLPWSHIMPSQSQEIATPQLCE